MIPSTRVYSDVCKYTQAPVSLIMAFIQSHFLHITLITHSLDDLVALLILQFSTEILLPWARLP